MTYHYSKSLDLPFDKAVEATIVALKAHGFGVLTTIDVRETLKQKIGAEFRPYVILGACNPAMALRALQAEDKIGTMLPCNVIVQQHNGKTEVSAVDPVASMQAVRNQQLADIAGRVRDELRAAIDELPGSRTQAD
jgi:uncharacterized protein (DUF302 family)